MSDVIRFLVLAAALGLAAGMVLGAAALMLAAPAYAGETAPAQEQCRPVFRPAPAAPRRLEV